MAAGALLGAVFGAALAKKFEIKNWLLQILTGHPPLLHDPTPFPGTLPLRYQPPLPAASDPIWYPPIAHRAATWLSGAAWSALRLGGVL